MILEQQTKSTERDINSSVSRHRQAVEQEETRGSKIFKARKTFLDLNSE